MPAPGNITQLLAAWSGGDQGALTSLMGLVYRDLRVLAGRCLRREREGHTLQPTALVHEAYARLVGSQGVPWQDRAHFFAVAAATMRRILVDHARKRGAARRGGSGVRIELDEPGPPGARREVDLLALNDALDALAALDPEQVRIVELRYFGGLTIDETAEALDRSAATVKREWTMARAWLQRALTRQ